MQLTWPCSNGRSLDAPNYACRLQHLQHFPRRDGTASTGKSHVIL
jgi:hypothetical protein